VPEGRIIFLNGASSSGKSSIAKALQAFIEEPCIHFCIDDYLGAFQSSLCAREDAVRRRWPDILRGFHAAGAAMARAGNWVIIDDVLEAEPPWVESLLELFENLDVVFVGVHCPLEELERRERERPERREGMARLQFTQVHAQAIYDLEVDTLAMSPQECAERIASHLKDEPRSRAFMQLREQHHDHDT